MFTIYTSYENAKFSDILRHVENENRRQSGYLEHSSLEKDSRKAQMVWRTLVGTLVSFYQVVLH